MGCNVVRMRFLIVGLAVSCLVACDGGRVAGAEGALASASAAPAASTDTAKAANPIFGTWRGTSICTPVRPACHDEIAVYHASASSKPETVAMMMNKVVDGQEVEMGGMLEYHVDYAARTLSCEIAARDGTRGVFSFTWSGKKMTGTLYQLPGREVVRNIALDKE
jgi:hypothetical protein